MCKLTTLRCNISNVSQDDIYDLRKLFLDEKVWRFLGGKRNQNQIEESIQNQIIPNKT